ncbi:sensor histidine kinase [Brevundimonas aurantiaca]|uniref:sensor histidine kinase n=1 Tax=Brevundimonas aurantiaca TaxID=74316 RepID=UPI002FDE328F
MTMSRALDIATAAPASAAGLGRSKAASDLFAHPVVPVLTGVAVALLVAVAVNFARSSGLMVGLWAASGVAVAVWLRTGSGRRHDMVYALVLTVSLMIGELISGNSPALSLLFTTADMIEIAAAVFLVRRVLPSLHVLSLDSAVRFLLCALIAPIPAGLTAAFGLAYLGQEASLESFKTWWFGHTLGIAVIGALGLSLTRSTLTRLNRSQTRFEAAGLMTAILAFYYIGFTGQMSMGFIMTPLLLAVAVRLGVAGSAFSLLIVSILAVGSAMAGAGPYVTGMERAEQVMMAQLLVLIGYMPTLLVAALLEERDRLAERARLGQVRAEMTSEAKSRLLANVAHEIKSPVAGVIGIGQLWSSGQLGPVTPKQAEMADMLVKTARQVEALAHDLLDVARAESGSVKVELRPTDVVGVLDDVRRSAVLLPEAQGVEITVVCEDGHAVAVADSQRLVQVVTNLAVNALKYGGAGGGVILRAIPQEDCVRIEVSDFGPGLSEEKQAQLFEPFNRLGLERSSVEGHGVGLALAKRLVELQGGAIGVVSAPGEGATFWIELPRA